MRYTIKPYINKRPDFDFILTFITKNNNAKSVNGDVIRQNGIVALSALLSDLIPVLAINDVSLDLIGLCDGDDCPVVKNIKGNEHRNLRGSRKEMAYQNF